MWSEVSLSLRENNYTVNQRENGLAGMDSLNEQRLNDTRRPWKKKSIEVGGVCVILKMRQKTEQN